MRKYEYVPEIAKNLPGIMMSHTSGSRTRTFFLIPPSEQLPPRERREPLPGPPLYTTLMCKHRPSERCVSCRNVLTKHTPNFR